MVRNKLRLSGLFFLAFTLAALPLRAQAEEPALVLQKTLGSPTASMEGMVLPSAELKAFYAATNWKPAWATASSSDLEKLQAFLDSVEKFAAYHGIEMDAESLTSLKALVQAKEPPAFPKIELLTTTTLLSLAHAMHGDRVKLRYLYPGWSFTRTAHDIPTELARAAEGNRVQDYIASLAPQNAAYTRLTEGLNHYREKMVKGGWQRLEEGPTIKAGEEGPRILGLKARLAAEDYLPAEENPSALYDEATVEAVKEYQRRNGLEVDGNVGAKTRIALNTPILKRIEQIIANMERWRHMPDGFPSRYVVVNNAAAQMEVWDAGSLIYKAPTVVGRVDRKTPFIESAIRSVIFNPSWHVPSKIAKKDILPKLRKDPHYLEKMGMVIKGSADDPYGAAINWHDVGENSFQFNLRQAPGDLNSLGRLKFDFDNDFAVYMHGTPHPELFAKAARHQSSGCIRLPDPEEFARIVLEKNEGNWTPEKITQAVDADKTKWIKVTEPLPLYVVHWTVFSESPDAPLSFRQDVYDYDRLLIDALRDSASKNVKKLQEVRL